jgi:Mrp family chromosome partitioning ATPase
MPAGQAQERDEFAAETRSLDMRDYWLILRRRWRLVATFVVLGAVAGGGYAVAKGPSYTATAQVVVAPVTQGPFNQSTTQDTSAVNMSTEQAIAQSAPVIQKAATTLHVPGPRLETSAPGRLTVSVPASTLTTSNVLQVAWEADTPALAQSGADAFANAYLWYRRQELKGEVSALQSTLLKQEQTLSSAIGTASTQLSNASGASARRILTIRLNQLTSQDNTAQTQLAALPTYDTNGGTLIPAVLPGKPSGFGRSVLIAVGLILGALLGLALAFGRDLFDDRLRDTSQFEHRLGAIRLAVLPVSEGAATGGARRGSKSAQVPAVSMAATPDSPAAEAVRAMRSSIVAVSARNNLRILLLVGADSSVSSSRVVAELGVALAESGRRVLLVASDLRGSLLPQIFAVPDTVGLSELLLKGGDPEVLTRRARQASGALLAPDVAERLSVLPSGQRTLPALSVLDSERMAELLRGQREGHDFVLLDAPAATEADVLALASHVDGVIVIARESQTLGRVVETLRHRVEQMGMPIIGGVFIAGSGLSRYRRRDKQGPAKAGRAPADRVRPEQAGAMARSAKARPAPATRPLPAVPREVSRTPDGTLKQPQ